MFVDGVATNDDFDVKSPLLRVHSSGSKNLLQDTVDYLVDAELVKACAGQSGASADKLFGVPLPIQAEEPFANPKTSPGWAVLGKKLAGSTIKDTAAILIEDKLKIPELGTTEENATGGDAFKEGLKSLF